jgi:8-oxo-dGTP diphosphatase
MDINEQAYLAAYDASRYSRPSLAVDVVLLTVKDDVLQALLMRRPEQPQQGRWALPGTFLRMDETLDEAAARALEVKAGLEGVYLEQLYTFSALDRDPRTRVLSVSYFALVESGRMAAAVAARGDDSLRLWRIADTIAVDEHGTPLELAFDHAAILAKGIERIRGKLGYSDIGFELLGETFTLRDLRRVYEAIGGEAGKPRNKDSFRRTMLASGVLEDTGEVLTGVGHRPPALYRFTRLATDLAPIETDLGLRPHTTRRGTVSL